MEGEQLYLGDLLTMVIKHVSKSWDDPPSGPRPRGEMRRQLPCLFDDQAEKHMAENKWASGVL